MGHGARLISVGDFSDQALRNFLEEQGHVLDSSMPRAELLVLSMMPGPNATPMPKLFAEPGRPR